MAQVSVSAAVREILTADINLTADEVVQKAKAMGLTATPEAVRKSVHNQRTAVRAALGSKPMPAAARTITPPKATTPDLSAPGSSGGASDLAAVLANVARVNTVVGVCGGVGEARQVAEAVQACGGVDAFLQHLDLVAGIRGVTP